MQTLHVVDTASTAAEEFDGETIVIQFRKGTYSVMTGSGPQIFAMLAVPCSASDITALIAESTGGSVDDIAREVESFVRALVEAEIVVATGEAAGETAGPFSGPFVTPRIETFEDLADMMRVDPVHEVDIGRGWPQRST
jgi:hypothetical protein